MSQHWAAAQNKMGNALQELGIRSGGEAGSELLSQAVSAYRQALEVYTGEYASAVDCYPEQTRDRTSPIR